VAKPSIQGLTDAQITGMIEVLSKQLTEYVTEWNRRLKEKSDADQQA